MVLFIFLLLILTSAPAIAQTPEPGIMQKLFLAKQVFPNVKTIGVLCNIQESTELLKSLKVAGTAYQIEIKIYDARDLMELRAGFDRMIKGSKIDLVWIIPDSVVNQKFGRRFLAEKCIERKIPLFVPSIEFLQEGGLFTISKDSDGASKVFVNGKVQEMIGLTFPPELQQKIVPVEY